MDRKKKTILRVWGLRCRISSEGSLRPGGTENSTQESREAGVPTKVRENTSLELKRKMLGHNIWSIINT